VLTRVTNANTFFPSIISEWKKSQDYTHELSFHSTHFWWCKKSFKYVWNTNFAKPKGVRPVIYAAMAKNSGGALVSGWFLLLR
jgi:hypothetical protein